MDVYGRCSCVGLSEELVGIAPAPWFFFIIFVYLFKTYFLASARLHSMAYPIEYTYGLSTSKHELFGSLRFFRPGQGMFHTMLLTHALLLHIRHQYGPESGERSSALSPPNLGKVN